MGCRAIPRIGMEAGFCSARQRALATWLIELEFKHIEMKDEYWEKNDLLLNKQCATVGEYEVLSPWPF